MARAFYTHIQTLRTPQYFNYIERVAIEQHVNYLIDYKQPYSPSRDVTEQQPRNRNDKKKRPTRSQDIDRKKKLIFAQDPEISHSVDGSEDLTSFEFNKFEVKEYLSKVIIIL